MEIREHNYSTKTRIGIYEPGNGTSYKAIAVPWSSGEYMQCLGSVADGWLVVNCLNGQSCLFQASGLLMDSYIQEKLGLGDADYPHFGDLIRKLIDRV